jgi:hypothetical protein
MAEWRTPVLVVVWSLLAMRLLLDGGIGELVVLGRPQAASISMLGGTD